MIQNIYPGKFIVLEGPEGGGKSTQASLLARAMEVKGHAVCLTQEPTKDGMWGQLVRFMYQNTSLREELPAELARFIRSNEYLKARELANRASRQHLTDFENIAKNITRGNYVDLSVLMQLCFIFDRHDHRVRVEIPALGEGKHVVSDRDFLSTLAYGASEGTDWDRLLLLRMHYEILGKDFVAPDLILLLDVPPEIGLARTAKKQEAGKEYFDSLETQKKIRKAYLEIVKNSSLISTDLHIVTIDAGSDEVTVHREIMAHAENLLMSQGFS